MIIREEKVFENGILISLDLCQDNSGFFIRRKNSRSNIVTKTRKFDNYGKLCDIDLEFGNKILDRISLYCEKFSDAFIFCDDININHISSISDVEDIYTSTGIKFWQHPDHMRNYKEGNSNTVITTHVSPEGACNLKCPYCSVTYRDNVSRIDIETIKDYIEKLMSRGLKAVILTGGGEPTLYPYINELIQWIKINKDLSVSIITNGTRMKNLSDKTLKCLSWLRISVNIFPRWDKVIDLDVGSLSEDCIVGLSYVYTHEHEDIQDDQIEILKSISKLADRVSAKYVRVLPNCLLSQEKIEHQRRNIIDVLSVLNDERFFVQDKNHGLPKSSVCHQSYFRPYLSEEKWIDGVPGSVYPCDSVVLNDENTFFSDKYKICKPSDILEYLDGNIDSNFTPNVDCSDCVFFRNVNMLDDWVNNRIDLFNKHNKEIIHEEFV